MYASSIITQLIAESLLNIVGLNQQPQQDASQVNSIFTLIYNLFGSVGMFDHSKIVNLRLKCCSDIDTLSVDHH